MRDELLDRSTREWVPPLAIGHTPKAMGDYDGALQWYERAYQARDFLLVMLHIEPDLRLVSPDQMHAIVDDPRFSDLVRRVGMAP